MTPTTYPFDEPAATPRQTSWISRWRAARRRGAAAAATGPAPAAVPVWRGAAPIATGDTDLWPALQDGRVCELHGEPPARALRVGLVEADLQALLAHLGAITDQVLGAHVRPRAAARTEGSHAVLSWAGPDDTEGGLRLARLFTRLSSSAAAPSPAERALHASVRAVLRIVHGCDGRAYAAPSPFSVMGLTVRLPLLTTPSAADTATGACA